MLLNSLSSDKSESEGLSHLKGIAHTTENAPPKTFFLRTQNIWNKHECELLRPYHAHLHT